MNINQATLTRLEVNYNKKIKDALRVMKEFPQAAFMFLVKTVGSAAAGSREGTDVFFTQAHSRFQEHTGNISLHDLATLKKNIKRLVFSQGLKMPSLDLYNDKNALYVGEWVDLAKDWPKQVRELCITAILENATCITGDSLFDAHDYAFDDGSSCAFTNYTTSALDATTLKAGKVAMAGVQLANGRSAGVVPTHLIVGETLWDTAFGLIEFQSADTANPHYKSLDLVKWPELSGDYANDWFLVDARDGDIIMKSPDVSPKTTLKKDLYQIEIDERVEGVCKAETNAIGGVPHKIYGGRVSAA